MHPLLPMIALTAAVFASIGCAKQSTTDSTTQQSTSTTPAPVAPSSGSTGASGAAGAFTDVSGDPGEQQIKDDAALGVVEPAGGAFKPDAPLSRAEFVRWLVKANNAYQKNSPANQIQLAHREAQFADVPPTHPDFPYIQGLANGGYVIGIDAKHFAPDRPITREELIAIKAPVDEGANIKADPNIKMYLEQYSDVNSMNPRYMTAIHEDSSVRTTRNIARMWRTPKAFFPKKAVSRSEAAIAVWEVGSGSAAVALGRTPPPPIQ